MWLEAAGVQVGVCAAGLLFISLSCVIFDQSKTDVPPSPAAAATLFTDDLPPIKKGS
tara:strand:- start:934 stop:1104 length:171 start_codon:yes stop_codon:yes gene_type:complete